MTDERDFELTDTNDSLSEEVERLTKRVAELERLLGNVEVKSLALNVLRLEQKVDRLDRR